MKLIFKALGLSGAAIALLFSVYYFNLDMKLVRFVVVPLLDKHYDMILRQGKMIQDLKDSLGLTPRGLLKIRKGYKLGETEQQEKPKTMLELVREKKRAQA